MVTGGCGFIGSHLVEQLISQGMEVHVLDNMVSGFPQNVSASAIIHNQDIRNKKAKQIISQIKPNVIFHLAAQADVAKSIQNPTFDADVNIKGTINVLEACREANVKKIVFASTSAVYGNLQKERISENDKVKPSSYYGLSKLTAESYIRLFSELYGIPYTILRYGNVYGPRQTPKGEGGVVAVFLDCIKKNKALCIHGDGEQTRDFIYVKDIVQANISAINHSNQQTIQVSTANSISINKLANIMKEMHASPLEIIHTSSRKGDIKHSCLDNSKARQLLYWQPNFNIVNGLRETYLFSQGS